MLSLAIKHLKQKLLSYERTNFIVKKILTDKSGQTERYKVPALSAFILMVSVSFPFSAVSAQGGISLGKTRVIYSEKAKSESISVSNSSKENHYLVQSWVEDASGKKTDDFIVVPPIYNSGPGDKNEIKIINIPHIDKTNSEKVYYLNVKTVPVIDKKDIDGQNVMIVTANTRIKLFLRPDKLPISLNDAAKKLVFSHNKTNLIIENPTPYYLTLTDIHVGTAEINTVMVAPFDKVYVTGSYQGNVSYKIINDYGGMSQSMLSVVK